MIARIVEVVAKRGRSEEVCRIVEQRILPLVRRLEGVLGKWTLVSRDDPRRIVVFSFWTTPAAVAEYDKSVYPQVYDILKDFIRTAPVAQVFDVATARPSTACRVAEQPAARTRCSAISGGPAPSLGTGRPGPAR